MLLHSEQNRKVICSAGFLRSPDTEAAGDDMAGAVALSLIDWTELWRFPVWVIAEGCRDGVGVGVP
jgi:hypothetical protein